MRQERQQQWIGGPELGGQVQSPGSNLESSSRGGIGSSSQVRGVAKTPAPGWDFTKMVLGSQDHSSRMRIKTRDRVQSTQMQCGVSSERILDILTVRGPLVSLGTAPLQYIVHSLSASLCTPAQTMCLYLQPNRKNAPTWCIFGIGCSPSYL